MPKKKEKIIPLTDEQRKVVEENHNLIYKVLNDHCLDVDEWYDVAAIGLCKAAQLFKPESGFKFSTYAYTSIYNVVCRQIIASKTEHRLPPGGGLLYLEEKYGNFEEDNKLEDLIPASNNSFVDDIITINDFKESLKKLNSRDQEIILLLADGYTYQAAGDTLGVSRERVRQIAVKYARVYGYKRDRKKNYNRSVK